ncbi:MAG: DUF1223 domain-containing protein [Alphaproteobacteria bacterium]
MKEFRTFFLMVACGLFVSFSAVAEIDLPPAVPVEGVAIEALPVPAAPEVQQKKRDIIKPPQDSVVPSKSQVREVLPLLPDMKNAASGIVLELFSTQACTFCPKADEVMKDFIARENIIALSCHVDYFDVREGSLSLPICSTRQIAYEHSLNIGPKYTPQMVMNGRYDAVGYHEEEVSLALNKAMQKPFLPVSIRKQEEGMFSVILPYASAGEYTIWLLVYEPPIQHRIADGANIGKDLTYYNVVSKAGFLGKWSGQIKVMSFYPKMNETSKGFAILVQDSKNNYIIAAGKFEK